MSLPSASIVVVSSGRPNWLVRCVRALMQLDYPFYEIVVVADDAGGEAVRAMRPPAWVRIVRSGDVGIAAARNEGLAAAAGEIVAFVDDDAAAEPSWLRHLVGAFAIAGVDAATGTVLGRNGISVQWRARSLDATGRIADMEIGGEDTVVPNPGPGRAVMLEGTNMAVRRRKLADMGGFDSAFRFLLEDADLALRLSGTGSRTAIVPLAHVHHGFAGSERRRADRTPTNLFDIGRSLAIFLRKHQPGAPPEGHLLDRREHERRRLVAAMCSGRLMPSDVERLLATYDAGVCAGLSAGFGGYVTVPQGQSQPHFRRTSSVRHLVLSGGPSARHRLTRAAKAAAARGEVASVFVLSPTASFHRLVYTADGYWLQTGGRFGRSVRNGPLFRRVSLEERVAEEVRRVAKVRGIGDTCTRGDEI